jgi:hypothetical protein
MAAAIASAVPVTPSRRDAGKGRNQQTPATYRKYRNAIHSDDRTQHDISSAAREPDRDGSRVNGSRQDQAA